MNIELLQDALNLLDDDMIEVVEKLRNEKSPSMKKHKKSTWMRWGAMAACLCLLAGSIYLTRGFGLVTKEEGGDWTPNHGGEQSVGVVPESDEDGTDVTDSMSNEVPSVLVEISVWNKEGFIGTVSGIVDTEKYPVGANVSVKFSDSIPDKTHFPVGSVVRVQFYKSEIIEYPYKETQHEIILYAETITLSEE